jgi:hypothetical protein
VKVDGDTVYSDTVQYPPLVGHPTTDICLGVLMFYPLSVFAD